MSPSKNDNLWRFYQCAQRSCIYVNWLMICRRRFATLVTVTVRSRLIETNNKIIINNRFCMHCIFSLPSSSTLWLLPLPLFSSAFPLCVSAPSSVLSPALALLLGGRQPRTRFIVHSMHKQKLNHTIIKINPIIMNRNNKRANEWLWPEPNARHRRRRRR